MYLEHCVLLDGDHIAKRGMASGMSRRDEDGMMMMEMGERGRVTNPKVMKGERSVLSVFVTEMFS